MKRETTLLFALIAAGFVCRASESLGSINVRPADPALEMSARQTSPPARKARSWAPWQAHRRVKNMLSPNSAIDDQGKSSTATWREENEPVTVAPPVDAVRRNPNAKAYISLLRPQNIPPSFGLVAAGALVASHTLASLYDVKVLLTALAASCVAVGSCVLNDWFDIGVDRINRPDRPLVTGEVVPEHALAIGAGFLVVAVLSAWAVHPVALQATIVASAGLTLAYTPLLKPLPLVKNVVVAAIIGAAVAAGGLAAGADVLTTLFPTVFTFFVVAHREVLMDIGDMEGDESAGVQTIPVLLGRRRALALATVLLTAGVACAITGILLEAIGATKMVAAALSVILTSPLYANVARVVSSDFSEESLELAVERTFGPLALILALMGFALR